MIPPLLLLLLTFLSILTVTFSSSDDSSVIGCSSPTMCGGVNISYPFWSFDGPPSASSAYCGYPGFMIDCQEGIRPLLQIGSGYYYNVTYIDYDSRIITINLIDTPNLSSCPTFLHNLTFSSDVSSSLKYTDADVNLTFFFGCSNVSLLWPDFQKNAILPCLGYYGGKSSYVSPSDKLVPPGNWTSTCEDVVVAPVMLDILNNHSNDLIGDLGEVLSSGFQLAWTAGAPEGCKECESSGGQCGFNQTSSSGRFVCFHGTQARDFRDGNVRVRFRMSKEASPALPSASVAAPSDRGKGVAS